jgi:hypothetical protein
VRRFLFTALSLLCLLIFIASAALWVRSYFAEDSLSYSRNRAPVRRGVGTLPGRLGFAKVAIDDDLVTKASFTAPEGWHFDTMAPGSSNWNLTGGATKLRFLGLQIERGKIIPGVTAAIVVLPFWFLCVISFPLPVFRARDLRRRRLARRAPHLCRTCGYDLRGTPDRCPECGGVPAVTVTPAN